MAAHHPDDKIPEQQAGAHKEFQHSVKLEDEDAADAFFVTAKDRLLHVNDWERLCGTPSAAFQLTDAAGQDVQRAAKTGDCIKITIPGPTTSAGAGHDWVQVENIVYDDYPDENKELVTMTVRPAANPQAGTGEETAHFFTDAATSNFIVERRHSRVTAYYYGRNEVTNTETDHLGDTVRNFVVGTGAKLLSSKTQWEGLITGLLSEEDAGHSRSL